MIALFVFLGAAGFGLLLSEVLNISVYGDYVNDLKAKAFLIKNKHRMYVDAPSDMIRFRGSIALVVWKVDGSLLCKWYIDGMGTVPRWSKTHRYINKMHKKLLMEKHYSIK